MSTTTDVIKAGSNLSKEETKTIESYALTTAEGDKAVTISAAQLQEMGFITPLASPEDLRAAFAYQQRMMAAILDESDYLYIVSWDDGKKRQQRIDSTHDGAMKVFEKVKALNGEMTAMPKKSGIVKLARALGITATRKRTEGLPNDSNAVHSYVEYEAFHERTGKRETGIGWCDNTERGGRISKHDVIATADTRAYNRAVLRLAGFGNVSADEIVAGASEGAAETLVEVPKPPKSKEMTPLPAEDNDEVLSASRAWAEAVARRSEKGEAEWAPTSKQDTRSARELRAKARRGNQRAAKQLGSLGLYWQGNASDGMGFPAFTVYEPPVNPADIEATWAAADKAKEQVKQTIEAQDGGDRVVGGKKKGMNLSGKGSDKDDEELPPDPAEYATTKTKSTGIPSPSPNADPITLGQAKKVSTLLKEVFDEKATMLSWLKESCHVDGTKHIHTNQYEPVMQALKNLSKEKKKNG